MLDTDIEIDEAKTEVLNILNFSENHVFLTGKAGTGKSTLLTKFREQTEKNVAVLAPTGVAALNVKGQTIHSFFSFSPYVKPESAVKRKVNKKKRELINALDILIIDEVSMLRADLLDSIDQALKFYREDFTAFGGVKMVFIGDMFQLPPVVSNDERDYFSSEYSTPYFFSAKVFRGLTVTTIELNKVYRQEEEYFVHFLNKIREKKVSDEDIYKFNNNCVGRELDSDLTVTLTTTNKKADSINMEKLDSLDGKPILLEGRINGDFDKKSMPTQKSIEVKKGVQVMLLNNDNSGRWVNGSMAKVLDFYFDSLYEEDVLKLEIRDGREVIVEPYTWEIYKYFLNEESNKVDVEVLGSFTQYPIKLAWAVTIHKSQGKTFDEVVLDLGRGTFAHGQLYVALSRCRTVNGLSLKQPIRYRDVIVDERIKNWFKVRENLT